jgi:hypothetical protein
MLNALHNSGGQDGCGMRAVAGLLRLATAADDRTCV